MHVRLIILCPGLRQIRQFRFGRPSFAAVAIACLASFSAAAIFALTYPSAIDDAEYNRLQAENQALSLRHQNVVFEAQRLRARISNIEKTSDRIVRELEAD